MVPDSIRMSNAVAQLLETEATDTSDYDYGTDHPILHARYASPALARNRLQVFGDDLFAQAFDWPEIEDQFDNVRQIFDLNLTTQTNVEDRAEIALRHETLAPSRGELVTPVNCGQDVNDVVSVTDEAGGLSEVDFRIAGIELRYVRRSKVRRSPIYEQRLQLSNV